MVDDTLDNHVVYLSRKPAWSVAFGLLGAFRELIDEANVLLAERGHPRARPVLGFTLQAIGDGASASEVAQRLGVSKQAAAKTLVTLEAEGYVSRAGDSGDGRRKIAVPTERGRSLLAESVTAFEEVLDRWRSRAGDATVDALQDALEQLGTGRSAKLDLGSWSS